MTNERPINAAARNAVWTYPRSVPPRFRGAPTIIEQTRSYQVPDFDALPQNAEVKLELYGGQLTFQLDGWLYRISIERFRWVRFADEAKARAGFLVLWNEIEDLKSSNEVMRAANLWHDRYEAQQPPSTGLLTERLLRR